MALETMHRPGQKQDGGVLGYFLPMLGEYMMDPIKFDQKLAEREKRLKISSQERRAQRLSQAEQRREANVVGENALVQFFIELFKPYREPIQPISKE